MCASAPKKDHVIITAIVYVDNIKVTQTVQSCKKLIQCEHSANVSIGHPSTFIILYQSVSNVLCKNFHIFDL